MVEVNLKALHASSLIRFSSIWSPVSLSKASASQILFLRVSFHLPTSPSNRPFDNEPRWQEAQSGQG